MHELLREAGGCALSAARRRSGVAGPALRARRAADRDVARDRDAEGANGAPLLVGALGWLECGIREQVERRNAHVLRLRGSLRSSSGSTHAAARARPRRVLERMSAVEAVVFDLDGVLVDSEHVWDEVREQLARERGGRWHDRAQADMMGMSSTEWSRYMHDVIGLAESPEEINAEVVRRMQARYASQLPLIDGAVEAVRRLATVFRLALASSSNRPLIDVVLSSAGLDALFEATVSSEEVRARKARSGRLPRGCATTRRRARRGAPRSRTRRTGSARRTRPGCASSRFRTVVTRLPPTRLRSPTSCSSRSRT